MKKTKKLVYRVDDFGFTETYDKGAKLAFEKGIATHADVMFDAPHAVEALKWLKERPWISIGWHRHFWGSPVLAKAEVPSMVDEEGRFFWRHNAALQSEATYEDCYKEFTAEIELCHLVAGRYPDTLFIEDRGFAFDKALKTVCKEHGVHINIISGYDASTGGQSEPGYESLKLHSLSPIKKDFNKYNYYDLAEFNNYNPKEYLMSPVWKDDETIMLFGHPGFLDDLIYKESTCNIHRLKELAAVTDEDVIQWVIDNNVELVSLHDVIYNTDYFQKHLAEINSPLAIKNR